jgi:hypothetical protein
MLEADMSEITDLDAQDAGSGTPGVSADELMHEALEADALVRRLEARLPALESRLDELTSEVQTEVQITKGDAAAVIGGMVDALGPDLLAALEPLKQVTARIIALEECLPPGTAGRARFEPFIPEPGHEPLYVGGGEYSKGPNLLKVDDATMTAARAAVADKVQCVRDVLALARSFQAYVPHERRPKPYVLKGTRIEYTGAPPTFDAEIIKR